MEQIKTPKRNETIEKETGLFWNKRNIYLTVATVVAAVLWMTTDPNDGVVNNLPFGAGLAFVILMLVRVAFLALSAHLIRKILFPYVEADFQLLLRKAKETPEGAGFAALAVASVFFGICILVAASAFM